MMCLESLVLLITVFTASATHAAESQLSNSRALKHSMASHATCGISPLGYKCWLQVCPKIAMHWSLGGPPPSLPGCRYPAVTDNSTAGAMNMTADTVHVALVTDLDGYVSMSLPKELGVMCPADSIIGFIQQADGQASVKEYYLDDMMAYLDKLVVLTNTAVESSSDGITACFSRPLSALGKNGFAMLSEAGAVAMNFAAASRSSSGDLHRHSMDSGHLCSAMIQLHATAQSGGEFSAGLSHGGVSSAHTAVWAHGIIMIIGWLVLLPAGVIAARHRWVFSQSPGLSPKSAAPAQWFVIHRAAQITGMVLFTAGFLLPWIAFGDHGNQEEEESLAVKAHGPIGITIASLAYAQLVLAFLRPKPDLPIRRWWNLQHWITGRAVVLLAAINILIGVQVCHEAWQAARTPWYTVVCLILVVVVVVGIVLEVQAVRRGAWLPLPMQDGGVVQMRSISAGATRQTEGTPLLHSLHTLE